MTVKNGHLPISSTFRTAHWTHIKPSRMYSPVRQYMRAAIIQIFENVELSLKG